MIKAFSAAGITNKIIAVFDNDAVGIACCNRIKKKNLPSNLRIMPLPDLPLATTCPTVGPQGNTTADINGRACSIEMYLGRDVLTNAGQLRPISWLNLEHQIKVYQGELIDKSIVQKLFKSKLDRAEKYGIGENEDWSSIHLILNTIFKVASL